MSSLKYRLVPIVIACLMPVLSTHALEKETIGWIEYVNLDINNRQLQLKAKIDTGAKTSSLNATIIQKYKKNDVEWVRFRVANNAGETIILERKIIRTVKIKRKLALSIKRPVVVLGICIGNVYREEEVNLANRENFVYQVLIGRNYLQGKFIVDSEIIFSRKPSCKPLRIKVKKYN